MKASASVFSIQRADERGHFDHGWLNTYLSFSFAEYSDPNNVQWGALRVLNDDRVAPAQGFPPHPHRDMEIVTYVLSGELAHKDSMGNHGVVGPGGVQYMSAGTGVRHSEFNNSRESELHFVQMWVLPAAIGTEPQYGQMDFSVDDRRNKWLRVAGGAGSPRAPIRIGQDASFLVARLEGAAAEYSFAPDRYGFLFVADGEVKANGEALHAGDAVRIARLERIETEGRGEILLWDVPPDHSQGG
jgi:quercetin 2,3-dioxygenase